MSGSHRVAAWTLAALVAVSACGSGGADSPSAVPPVPPTTPVGASDDLDFTTPSGNISCEGADSPGGVYLQCQVSRDRWRMPSLAADECDGDLVSGRVFLGPDGPADLVDCATDAVDGGETQQREYGRPVRAGRFYCVTRESGLRCENTENGHGFELSQATYELF